MKYIIVIGAIIIAFIIYRQIKKAQAIRRRKEDAKNRAILQEILDSRR
jgi:large-conductance mechanosensitive channel